MKIIAEFCQNHNGDFEILKKMVHEAAEGGATHGKIQTIFADDLSYREIFETGKTDGDGKVLAIKRPYRPEYDRLKKLELSFKQQEDFIEVCKSAGIEPLTTVFNHSRLADIARLGWTSIKIASYDCGSIPLIREASKQFKEIIVSTGATYDHEIEAAAATLKASGKHFSLLHCVTIYPTPLDQMNLARMNFLRKLSNSVGLSEHTLTSRDGVKACLAAIYLGATIIERHFTVLDESLTRDGKVSVRKEHLKTILDFSKLSKSDQEMFIEKNIPEFSLMIGTEKRDLSHEELLNREYYRGRFCSKVSGSQVFNWEEPVLNE